MGEVITKLTAQHIFRAGYAAFAQGHRLPDYVRRAAWAILVCRTAVLGGHVQACPEGHIERVWYNSCRHRLCPQCRWLQIELEDDGIRIISARKATRRERAYYEA